MSDRASKDISGVGLDEMSPPGCNMRGVGLIGVAQHVWRSVQACYPGSPLEEIACEVTGATTNVQNSAVLGDATELFEEAPDMGANMQGKSRRTTLDNVVTERGRLAICALTEVPR